MSGLEGYGIRRHGRIRKIEGMDEADYQSRYEKKY